MTWELVTGGAVPRHRLFKDGRIVARIFQAAEAQEILHALQAAEHVDVPDESQKVVGRVTAVHSDSDGLSVDMDITDESLMRKISARMITHAAVVDTLHGRWPS